MMEYKFYEDLSVLIWFVWKCNKIALYGNRILAMYKDELSGRGRKLECEGATGNTTFFVTVSWIATV